MDADEGEGGDSGALVVEKEKAEVKLPPMYKVVMLNDDYTTMEFVIHVLQQFFAMDVDKAYDVMMSVHNKGKGICGVYTKEIAETKAEMANQYSRQNGHPLLCEIEPE